MIRTISSTIILCFFVFGIASPCFAGSGWVDDWLSSKTEQGGSYYEGQQRGFHTGGSFSSRWQSSSDNNLMTIEKPRLSAGCGGIDVFMGAFSFMNFDKLVEKLQGMLMNAASIAFDMALQELCISCSTIIKAFEAITDRLNATQMDECAMAKSSVTYVKDMFTSPNAKAAGEAATEQTLAQRVSSGVSDMWTQAKVDAAAAKGQTTEVENVESLEGCSLQLKEIFLNDMTPGEHMLLADIAKTKFGMEEEHVNLIRGMIGDIQVGDATNGFTTVIKQSCVQNDGADVKSFIAGEVYSMDETGACALVTDTNANLVQNITNQMASIAIAYRTQGTITTEQQTFIDSNPLSIGKMLEVAVGTRQEGTVIATMSVLTAKAHVLALFGDLFMRSQRVIERIEAAIDYSEAHAADAENNTCDTSTFEALSSDAKVLKQRSYKLMELMRESYRKDAAEFTSIIGILEQSRTTEMQLRQKVLSRFGASIEQRM